MEKKDWIKCFACGHGTDIKPNEPFEEIFVNVHDSQYMGIFMINGNGVHLYACPKCGTVKMEK